MSSNHASLAYNSQAYWDFTFDGLAEDVRANMRDVFIDSGFKKGYYFGYSAGSIQMEIALSKYDSELKNYLNRAILLAPCTVSDNSTTLPNFEPGVLYDEMVKAGVYASFGPNFNTDAVCEKSSEEACKFAGSIDGYFADPMDRMPVSFRIYDHLY